MGHSKNQKKIRRVITERFSFDELDQIEELHLILHYFRYLL